MLSSVYFSKVLGQEKPVGVVSWIMEATVTLMPIYI